MNQLSSSKADPLVGTVTVPGDKSISHRALIMGALSVGESKISGLLEGEDVLGTAAALRALGADISKDSDACWHVHGVGIGGLKEPDAPLDMGNSGTGVRLLMGLVATHPIEVTFTGDKSLSSRPMKRVTDPLSKFVFVFDVSVVSSVSYRESHNLDHVPGDPFHSHQSFCFVCSSCSCLIC